MKFWGSYREWDCYYDRPGDEVTHYIGFWRGRQFFIGVQWITVEPWEQEIKEYGF